MYSLLKINYIYIFSFKIKLNISILRLVISKIMEVIKKNILTLPLKEIKIMEEN
jgi:hypothetical protein